jgi:hypothetical protein
VVRQTKIPAILAGVLTAIAAAGVQQPGSRAPGTVVHTGRLVDGMSTAVRSGLSIALFKKHGTDYASAILAGTVAGMQRLIFVMKGGQVYTSAGSSRPSAPDSPAREGGHE